MVRPVVLAPVPCVNLASANSIPGLCASVFFANGHEAEPRSLSDFKSKTSINRVPR